MLANTVDESDCGMMDRKLEKLRFFIVPSVVSGFITTGGRGLGKSLRNKGPSDEKRPIALIWPNNRGMIRLVKFLFDFNSVIRQVRLLRNETWELRISFLASESRTATSQRKVVRLKAKHSDVGKQRLGKRSWLSVH